MHQPGKFVFQKIFIAFQDSLVTSGCNICCHPYFLAQHKLGAANTHALHEMQTDTQTVLKVTMGSARFTASLLGLKGVPDLGLWLLEKSQQ